LYEVNELRIYEVSTEVSGSVKYHQSRAVLPVKFVFYRFER